MRRILIAAAAIALVIVLGVFIYQFPHNVNRKIDGYIIYQNGSEMSCSVSIEGKHSYKLFQEDVFDGTISVNNANIDGTSKTRVTFGAETGLTSYDISSTYSSSSIHGELLLNQNCDTLVLSCCYDNIKNTETTDETYRCLIVAPAKNYDDTKSVLSSIEKLGRLEQFTTWIFK
jgi:hypothetical protein